MDRTPDSDRFTSDGRTEFVVERNAGESANRAIVRGVAAVTGVPEAELDSPFEHVDVDALENAVNHVAAHDNDLTVEFDDGPSVRAREDGSVRSRRETPSGSSVDVDRYTSTCSTALHLGSASIEGPAAVARTFSRSYLTVTRRSRDRTTCSRIVDRTPAVPRNARSKCAGRELNYAALTG